MHTKLKLSHDEIVVLTAIADQELMHSEIEDELFRFEWCDDEVDLKRVLAEMVQKQLLTTDWKWVLYYAIAPEVLSLNSPPYRYESWRDLSE